MAWVGNHYRDIPKLPHEYRIYFGADFQLGSRSCDRWIVKNWVKRVTSDPNSAWAILGDIEDNDRPTTRSLRKSAFSDRPEVITADEMKHLDWQKKHVLPLLAPLTTRPCLGILAGHHWTQIGRDTSTMHLCRMLTALKNNPVPYLGQISAWVWIRFNISSMREQKIKRLLHLQHGTGGGGTLAAALNKLEKTAQGFYADAYVRAHDCKLVSAKYDILAPKDSDKPGLIHKTIALMNVGAATRGYEITLGNPGYPEMGMMRPQTLGWGVLRCLVYKQQRALDKSKNETVEFRLDI